MCCTSKEHNICLLAITNMIHVLECVSFDRVYKVLWHVGGSIYAFKIEGVSQQKKHIDTCIMV